MNATVPPGFAAFRAAYDAGRGSLVWRKGVSDLDTPVAAFLKLAHGQPNSFLLESVELTPAERAQAAASWRARRRRREPLPLLHGEVRRHAPRPSPRTEPRTKKNPLTTGSESDLWSGDTVA